MWICMHVGRSLVKSDVVNMKSFCMNVEEKNIKKLYLNLVWFCLCRKLQRHKYSSLDKQ